MDNRVKTNIKDFPQNLGLWVIYTDNSVPIKCSPRQAEWPFWCHVELGTSDTFNLITLQFSYK